MVTMGCGITHRSSRIRSIRKSVLLAGALVIITTTLLILESAEVAVAAATVTTTAAATATTTTTTTSILRNKGSPFYYRGNSRSRSSSSIQDVMQNIPRGGGTPGEGAQQPIATKAKFDDDVSIGCGGGTATIPNEVFNLVKSIVGAGVLSLPAGIAAFGNAKGAMIPAAILITFFGGISGYCFSLLGKVCAVTGSKSYREAWDNTIGSSTSWIVASASTFVCFFANLAYSMILADTLKDLLSGVLGIDASRTGVLLGVTCFILTPLCLLKNLSALAPFSLLGILGMTYTIIAMAIRYLDGSYSTVETAKAAAAAGAKAAKAAAKEGVAASAASATTKMTNFLKDLQPQYLPKFGTDKGVWSVFESASSFIFMGMLSTAYLAHYNAPKFYMELKNNTMKRYNSVVSTSFGISVLIFIAVALLGFFTFGSASDGLILNNYSNNDVLMSFSRIAVAVSIVFSYPLVFVGTRDGLFDLANIPIVRRTTNKVNLVTLAAIAFITVMAMIAKDLSFVLSFAGATLGNALIYVFPSLMFQKITTNTVQIASTTVTALIGIVMGVIGAYQSIKTL